MSETKLRPGDDGYKGGKFTSTVIGPDGKTYRCYTVKDENGNIISETITPLLFGTF